MDNQTFSNMISNSWKTLIEPPRAEYSELELPLKITAGEFSAQRHPFVVQNAKGLELKCHIYVPSSVRTAPSQTRRQSRLKKSLNSLFSFFSLGPNNPCKPEFPENATQSRQQPPTSSLVFDQGTPPIPASSSQNCIVYCHSQGSCCTEGLFLLEACVESNVCFCVFDFAGSGKSSGEFVSLGIFERLDIEKVVEHIQSNYKISKVSLWGRSMGAVAAFLYTCSQASKVCSIVLDSPYVDLSEVVAVSAKKKLSFGSIISPFAKMVLSNQIEKRLGVDIFSLNIPSLAQQLQTPVCLIGSPNDETIPPNQFNILFNSLRSSNKIYLQSAKKHAEPRELEISSDAFTFIVSNTQGTTPSSSALASLAPKSFAKIRTWIDTTPDANAVQSLKIIEKEKNVKIGSSKLQSLSARKVCDNSDIERWQKLLNVEYKK